MQEKWGIYSFFRSDELRVNVQFLFLFLFQWPSILLCVFFSFFFISPNSIQLIKPTASGSLLPKALCSVHSHVPTAHTNPSTPQTPLWKKGEEQQEIWKRAHTLTKILYSTFYFYSPLNPCPWLLPWLSLISSSCSHALSILAQGSPLMSSPCCVFSCPQASSHISHLWPSGWEQVEKQVVI